MSQNNALAPGKLQRCQTQRSNAQIIAEIMQTYDLLKFALARSNGSSFLIITQYEMPFINKCEAAKRPKCRKINGKCTNDTHRRSSVWPVYFIYHRCIYYSLAGVPLPNESRLYPIKQCLYQETSHTRLHRFQWFVGGLRQGFVH